MWTLHCHICDEVCTYRIEQLIQIADYFARSFVRYNGFNLLHLRVKNCLQHLFRRSREYVYEYGYVIAKVPYCLTKSM